jgi:hypothetical protein
MRVCMLSASRRAPFDVAALPCQGLRQRCSYAINNKYGPKYWHTDTHYCNIIAANLSYWYLELYVY